MRCDDGPGCCRGRAVLGVATLGSYPYDDESGRLSVSCRRPVLFPPVPHVVDVWVESGLPGALSHLTTRQRQAVVLVYGYGMSHTEAAALLGVKRSTIQNHVERGLDRLRSELGVHHHA
ncbi:MAG TPA: sigma-70 family RNA polymerase sigma factor [Actinobacteria bacterium]|nr:sigma-70 family RNA polymerase sigma factor [Actinomycetota bacterium]